MKKEALERTTYGYLGTSVNSDNAGGLISLALPDIGFLLRSQSNGSPLELEFTAFFSLLEIINGQVDELNIKKVHIYSSLPEFIFSFAKSDGILKPGSAYRSSLESYNKRFQISVGYINRVENRAFANPADLPSLPEGQEIKLNFDFNDLRPDNL